MNAYKINSTLTSFTMNSLVKAVNFLASKQASKQGRLDSFVPACD